MPSIEIPTTLLRPVTVETTELVAHVSKQQMRIHADHAVLTAVIFEMHRASASAGLLEDLSDETIVRAAERGVFDPATFLGKPNLTVVFNAAARRVRERRRLFTPEARRSFVDELARLIAEAHAQLVSPTASPNEQDEAYAVAQWAWGLSCVEVSDCWCAFDEVLVALYAQAA